MSTLARNTVRRLCSVKLQPTIMAAAAPASESSAVDTAAAIALGAGGPPAQSGDAAIAAARTLFDMPEGITHLGPGAAGPDLLGPCAGAMAEAAQTVLTAPDAASLMQYGPVRGDGRYIAELSSFLSEHYGDTVEPERLVLTSGATAGCSIICSLFFKPGDPVFIEDPSYFLAVEMFRDYGLRMISVDSDQEGMRMESLDAEVQLVAQAAQDSGSAWLAPSDPAAHKGKADGARFDKYNGLIFIVPTFGNPTGATLPAARRQRLVQLARRHNLLVLSDDVYQLLAFPGVTPPPRLVTYDLAMGAASRGGRCHVLSNGSFSKLIGPGNRLGWFEAGSTMVAQLLRSGVLASSGSMNHLTSGIMAEVLRNGAQSRILATLRATFAERASALCDALEVHLPAGAEVFARPQGGFFVWLVLPRGVRADAVIGLTMQNEEIPVGALPGNNFSPTQRCGSCLRLAFTFFDADRLARAAAVLGSAITTLGAKAAQPKSD